MEMTDFDPSLHPHRRFNPLTKEYVLVSPHRARRPWLGHVEPPTESTLHAYDPQCYLCPRNSRTSGQVNPTYTGCYSFSNDFPAVLSETTPTVPTAPHPLLVTEPVKGYCDVLIYHPRHDLTMARLSVDDILRVIEEWAGLYKRRGEEDGVNYVQIFENKGAIMGCSNPHPHGQVWSTSAVPSLPAAELASLTEYALSHPPSDAPKGPRERACLLCEYAHLEVHAADGPRVVLQNEHWVALVPWWAVWPFEVLLLPYRRHIPSLLHLTVEERHTLAQILSEVTVRYDNLFSCAFAYSMGIHQQPVPRKAQPDPNADGSGSVGEDDDEIAHLHLHFSPPLLRSATVRKFLVGYELMAEPQRDLTPEQAAQRLRELPATHYLDA